MREKNVSWTTKNLKRICGFKTTSYERMKESKQKNCVCTIEGERKKSMEYKMRYSTGARMLNRQQLKQLSAAKSLYVCLFVCFLANLCDKVCLKRSRNRTRCLFVCVWYV